MNRVNNIKKYMSSKKNLKKKLKKRALNKKINDRKKVQAA